MKQVKRFLSLLYYLVFSLFLLNAQISGFEISTQVYKQFNSKDLQVRTQNLVNSSENQFPFNITITFNSADKNRGFSSKNFLIVIDQEQALKHQDLIQTLLSTLKDETYDFTITVLLAYGDNPLVFKKDMLSGTQVYLANANVNENTTAMILDLEGTKNEILTSSNGISSPSFLVKTALNLYSKNDIKITVPAYYVSQQYNFKFFSDSQLDFFFSQGIPAIKLRFTKLTSPQNTYLLCKDFISSYSQNTDFLWDQHFIIFKLFNTYKRIGEQTIVRMIMILFFACILFVFILGFVNANIKTKAWKKIRKVWFSAPVIFILILVSFFIGKGEYLLFANKLSYSGRIVFLFTAQCICSFILCSVVFIIHIKKQNKLLSAKAADFLIVFTSSLNLLIFSLLDISLFPLLLINILFSIFILILNKKYLHIILLALMITIYIPYINTIMNSADLFLFQKAFTENNLYFVAESLLLTPIILTYFRILISFKNNLITYKKLLLATSIGFIMLIILLGTTAVITVKKYNTRYVEKTFAEPFLTDENNIKISVYDKKVFTDNVRKLNIDLPENTVQCDVEISTTDFSPVLYSDSDFIMRTTNSSAFLIPSKPGNQLVFNYGFLKPESIITVTAVYFDSMKGSYFTSTSHITTGSTNE